MRKAITVNLFLLTLFASGLFLLSKQVLADCGTQYGAACVKTGPLQVTKKVWNPDSGSFVDNLGFSDHKFAPGDEITFRIFVKNAGDTRFDTVHVIDTLPSFFNILESGFLSYDITNLDPGQTDEREIKVKVVSADQLPSDQKVICSNETINTVEARSGDNFDKATSQVCLERKVMGAKVLPVTGPSAIPIIAFLSLLVTGFALTLKNKAAF